MLAGWKARRAAGEPVVRLDALAALAGIEGVYVPSLYESTWDDDGRLLGTLGTYLGRGRRVTGVRIGVFVAGLDERPDLSLSPEVAAAHWIPLEALAPSSASVPEWPEPVPAYTPELDGRPLVVWGITYGILELLRSVA